jgi:hypothetical protein
MFTRLKGEQQRNPGPLLWFRVNSNFTSQKVKSLLDSKETKSPFLIETKGTGGLIKSTAIIFNTQLETGRITLNR